VPALGRAVKPYKPVAVIVAVIVAVAGPVIVAVHLNGNATVSVIEKVRSLTPVCKRPRYRQGTWVTKQSRYMGDTL
jgi:hypothetical protein